MEAANVTVYRMDKNFPGGADGRLVEMAAEDMACLVAKGGDRSVSRVGVHGLSDTRYSPAG